jgi:MYXO-CTERM domain-containing protein
VTCNVPTTNGRAYALDTADHGPDWSPISRSRTTSCATTCWRPAATATRPCSPSASWTLSFGGSATAPDLVAYDENGQPFGADGFARLVVPGDAAGGRYVSNLVSLQVIDATAGTSVPEPGSFALPLAGLTGLATRRRRKV